MEKLTMCVYQSGFEPELLAMIPRPVRAIIFLFPLTPNYEKFKEEEEARLTKLEQSLSPDVIFFEQTVENACGMIALLHSLANNEDIVGKQHIGNDKEEEHLQLKGESKKRSRIVQKDN